MAGNVKINFSIAGMADVERAFASVEKRVISLEKASVTSMSREERERKRIAASLLRTEERARAQAARLAERSEQQKTKAAQKAASEEERAAKRAAEAQKREIDRLESYRMRVRQSSFRMEQRLRDQEMRELERGRAKRSQFAQGVVGRVGNTVGGLTRAATGLAGGALALGGGFAIADSLRDRMSAEKAAINLSNSAYIPGQNKRPDTNAILSASRGVAASTNIGQTELIGGLQQYVAMSSDFEGGLKNLGEFAKMAKATGTDFKDIMSAAGALRMQNQDLSPDAMMAVMRNTVGQGRLGAVEFKDLAGMSAKVTASSGAYQGDQGVAQSRLLGLAQLAIKTAGSPEEAATAVTHLSGDALKHRDKFAGMGIFDNKGRMADPAEVIAKVLDKAQGDIGKVGDMGFGDRSIRLFQALQPVYNKAEEKNKGSGKAAVLAEVNKITGASYSKGDIQTDFGRVMASTAEKFEATVLRLKEVFADKFMPYLERFVAKLPELEPKIMRVIDGMAKLADMVLESPIASLGTLIAAVVMKDIAAAAIGQRIAQVVTNAAAASSGMSLRGVGAMSGVLPGVGLALATGAGVVDSAKGGAEGGADFVQKAFLDIRKTREGVQAGTVSPEEAAKKARYYQGIVSKAHDDAGGANAVLAGVSAPLSLVSKGARNDVANYNKAKEIDEYSESLAKSLKALAEAAAQAQAAGVGSTKPDAARTSTLGSGARDPSH
jgi:hypothetical protein